MSKRALFATSNDRKIQEATTTLEKYDIQVEAITVDIDEIQHHDPIEITKSKARAAYEVTHRPVVVQDTSWEIPALGGFPGGYMKDVAEWWQPQDWLNIIEPYDRTVICHEHVAYFDGENMTHFQSSYTGKFTAEARGEWGNSIEKVINLYGIGTLAEVHDETGIASAGTELKHWQQFGEWYSKRL